MKEHHNNEGNLVSFLIFFLHINLILEFFKRKKMERGNCGGGGGQVKL